MKPVNVDPNNLTHIAEKAATQWAHRSHYQGTHLIHEPCPRSRKPSQPISDVEIASRPRNQNCEKRNDHGDQDPESERVPDERILNKLVMHLFRLLALGLDQPVFKRSSLCN